METRFSRLELLYGKEKVSKLASASILVVGVGGVGGYVVETLARSGIGSIDLIDKDVVAISNFNRQIISNENTLGKSKVEVCKERILSINPDCKVNAYKEFYSSETASKFDLSKYDYIVDAIDSVKSKIELIVNANKAGTKIISAMGAANKVDPTRLKIADIYKTEMDPIAKILRYALRKEGIKKLKVAFSNEEPIKVKGEDTCLGSNNVVPPVMGIYIANEVINDLIRE